MNTCCLCVKTWLFWISRIAEWWRFPFHYFICSTPMSAIYFSRTNEGNKVGGTLCYLSLHVCLCWCLSVKADSRVSAISLLPSCAWPSSSTVARKSMVWKREPEVEQMMHQVELNENYSMTWTTGKTRYCKKLTRSLSTETFICNTGENCLIKTMAKMILAGLPPTTYLSKTYQNYLALLNLPILKCI